jgi:hypothetical protein
MDIALPGNDVRTDFQITINKAALRIPLEAGKARAVTDVWSEGR